MTDAFVHVMVQPGAVTEAAREIASRDGISEVHLTTGQWDLIVQLEVDSKDEIGRVVTEEIHSVTGVIETETSVAFEP